MGAEGTTRNAGFFPGEVFADTSEPSLRSLCGSSSTHAPCDKPHSVRGNESMAREKENR